MFAGGRLYSPDLSVLGVLSDLLERNNSLGMLSAYLMTGNRQSPHVYQFVSS